MKPVSDLYGLHAGEDVYVVGTGASIRTFPVSFLADKVTIGLNQAWKVAPVRYGLTIGPHLNIPEFLPDEPAHPEITWITKRGKAQRSLTPEQMAHAEAHFYYFEMQGRPNRQPLEEPSDSGRILDWVREPTGDFLYQWSSISQTALNLAANLGARSIVLVGCDNCALLDNHHAHAQHTKWMGAAPDRRYLQYYEGLVEVRRVLRERGVDVVSMTPFLKLDEPERDFEVLCDELGVPRHVAGRGDVSEADHPSRFLDESPAAHRSPWRRLTHRLGVPSRRSG